MNAGDRAHIIVGGFLADHRDRWIGPGILAALAREVRVMLGDEIGEDRIRRGLDAWYGSGDKPAQLRSHVRQGHFSNDQEEP